MPLTLKPGGVSFLPCSFLSPALCAPVRLLSLSPLTCLGQQRRHGPRHEEDTADKAHLNEKHLPPLANFKYFGDYCLFGRARGACVVSLHPAQLARLPLFVFCVLESRRNCLFTRNRAGMWSSSQAAPAESRNAGRFCPPLPCPPFRGCL